MDAGYTVLKITKDDGAYIYASGAYDDATGATGAGGHLYPRAFASGWTDVRFVNIVGAGLSMPVDNPEITYPTTLYKSTGTVIQGVSGPTGDIRGEGTGYVGIGSAPYTLPRNTTYSGAIYAIYEGTHNYTGKVGVGTTAISDYYEGGFTTKNLYEFASVFNVDTGDLVSVTTGSGVHRRGDVTLQFGLGNPVGGTMTSSAAIAQDPFISGQKISILDTAGGLVFPNYRITTDSIFNFTVSQNADVFGTYTKDFGVRNDVVNYDGTTQRSEFYLYGNDLYIDNVSIKASGATFLNQSDNTGNFSPRNTGGLSQEKAADAVKYFNNQEITGAAGISGQLGIQVSFENNPTYTDYGNLAIFAGTGENFETNEGSLLSLTPLQQIQKGQHFPLFPNDGIPQNTGLYLKLAVDTPEATTSTLYTYGPVTIERIPVGGELFVGNQGDQSIDGCLDVYCLSVSSGNATGTGIGGRLTGPGGLPYMITGDSPAESQTLQQVTEQGNTTDQGIEVTAGGISCIGTLVIDEYLAHDGDADTYLSFPSNNNFKVVTAGSNAFSIDGSQGITMEGNVGIGSGPDSAQKLQVVGNSVEVKLATTDGYSIKSPQKAIIAGVGIGTISSTGSMIAGGSGHHISGDYDTIAGGTLNNISGGDFNFIGGGSQIDLTGSEYSSSVGGKNNDILNSNYSIIGGGLNNKVKDASSSFIGGGEGNEIHDPVSAIVGGDINLISGGNGYSFIGGGEENEIHGTFSSVLGGEGNKNYGNDSVTLGGWFSESSGRFALVGPGKTSKVSGDYAVALGNKIEIPVAHTGATVLADGQDRVHASSGMHTATLDFVNGVYVESTSGMYLNGNPVMTGASAVDVDTLQIVTDRGNTTTNSIAVHGQYLSGVSGVFESVDITGTDTLTVTGSVGIGTSSPSTQLDVIGTGIFMPEGDTSNAIRIGYNASLGGGGSSQVGLWANGGGKMWLKGYADTYIGYDKFVTIKDGGSVGIGTTAPDEKLDIINGCLSLTSGKTSEIYLNSDTSNYGDHAIKFGFFASKSYPVALVGASQYGYCRGTLQVWVSPTLSDGASATVSDKVAEFHSGKVETYQRLNVHDDLIEMGDSQNAGAKAFKFSNSENKAAIWSVPQGSYGRADMRFTVGDQAVGTEKTEADAIMRIAPLGGVAIGNAYIGENIRSGGLIVESGVGIGTTAPLYPLDVAGSPGETYAKIGYYWTFVSDTINSAGALKLSAPASEEIRLQHNGVDRLTVLRTDGYVGIGTTAPSYRLHVSGDVGGTGLEDRITLNGTGYLLSGDVAGEEDTLQTVTDRGATTTTNISGAEITGTVIIAPTGQFNIITTDAGTLQLAPAGPYIGMFDNEGNSKRLYGTNVGLGYQDNAVSATHLYLGAGIDSPDVKLTREAANVLALRNSTAAQQFNIYNDYTSSTDYERVALKWDSDVFAIDTQTGSAGGAVLPLDFRTSGQSALYIDAGTQNVGIGTTSPTSFSASTKAVHLVGTNAELKVETNNGGGWAFSHYKTPDSDWLVGADNDDKFRISSNGSNLADATLTIETGGYVGIGTANPDTMLQVYGGDIKLAGDETPSQPFTLKARYGGLWMIGDGSATNEWMMANLMSHDYAFHFKYTPGTIGATGGIMKMGQQSKNSSTYTHGITAFYTDGTERLRIDGDGNVGIGTAAAGSRFHVYDGTSADAFKVENYNRGAIWNSAGAGGMYSEYQLVGAVKFRMGQANHLVTDESTSNFALQYAGDLIFAYGLTEAMRMDHVGRVGIKNNDPQYELHVSGDVGGTGAGDRITLNGTPYLLSGDSPAETQTLQDVTTNGNTTTTSIAVHGQYLSGVTGIFESVDITGTDTLTVTGNVGIGTAAPAYPLQVAGNVDADRYYVGTNTYFGSAGTNHGLISVSATSYGLSVYCHSADLNINTANNAGLGFSNGHGANYNTVDARFFRHSAGVIGLGTTFGSAADGTLTVGDVGIGTTAPLSTLDVRGDISGSGSFLGTGVGNRITNNGTPYLLSGDAAAALTLQDVCDNGSTTTTSVTISDDLTVDTDTLLVDASNDNVGIGTQANDNYDLQIYSAGAASNARGATLNLATLNNNVTGSKIRFTESTSSFQGTYMHYDGSANKFHLGVHDTSNTTLSDDTAVITIERETAKVGIGSTSPTVELDVASTGFDGSMKWTHDSLFLHNTGYKNQIIVGCKANSPTGSYLRLTEGPNTIYQGGYIQYDGSNNNLNIGVNDGGTAFTHDVAAITIERETAYVGIGTNAPITQLDVIGTGLFSDRVGIGTDAPSEPLEVVGDALIDRIYLGDGSSLIDGGGGNYTRVHGTIGVDLTTWLGGYHEALSVRKSATDALIGINDGSPSYQLDVNGTGYFVNGVLGTGAGNRITNNGVPYLLSGDAAAALTLQDVCDNGSTTTTSISGATGLFNDIIVSEGGIIRGPNAEDRSYAQFDPWKTDFRYDDKSILQLSNGIVINNNAFDMDVQIHAVTANALFIEGSSANVGLGTSAPTEKLDVRGDTFLSGNASIDGNIELPALSRVEFGPYNIMSGEADANSVTLQKVGSNYKFQFSTQVGSFSVKTATQHRIELDGDGESAGGYYGAALTYGEHAAASNNNGRVLECTNGSAEQGNRGRTYVNGNFYVQDYSTESAVLKAEIRNDGSAYFYGAHTSGVSGLFSDKVGIGTADPEATLQVGTHSNTMPSDTALFLGVNDLRFSTTNDNADYGSYLKPSYDAGPTPDVSILTLGTRFTTTDTDVLTLYGSNVGIGTTAPNSALEVRGGNIDIGTNRIQGFNTSCKIEMSAANVFKISNENNGHGIDFYADDLTLLGGALGYRKIVTDAGNLSIEPVADLLLNENGGSVGIGIPNPSENLEVSGNVVIGQSTDGLASDTSWLSLDGYYEHGLVIKGYGNWTQWRVSSKVNGNLEIYNTGASDLDQQVYIGHTEAVRDANVFVWTTGSVLSAGRNSETYPILDLGIQDAAHGYNGDAYIDVRESTTPPSRFHFKKDGEFIASGVSVTGTVAGTGAGGRITLNGTPYLLSGDAAAALTLQDVCDNDNSTTTSILSTGPHISGVTGLFSDNLGIGTNNPLSKLYVSDPTNSSINAASTGHFTIGGPGYALGISMDAVGASIYHNSPSRTLSFGTDYTVRMTIAAAGNVGIGTITPTSPLEVKTTFGGDLLRLNTTSVGHLLFSSSTDDGRSVAKIATTSSSLDLKFHSSSARSYFQAGQVVGIGTYDPQSQLQVIGTGLFSENVGIGTTTPNKELHVVGDIWGYSSAPAGTGDAYSVAGGSALDGNTRMAGLRFDRLNDVAKFGCYKNSSFIEEGYIAITSGGLVGIGTTVPATELYVKRASSAGGANADTIFQVENDDHANIVISTPSAKVGRFGFGDASNSLKGFTAYDHGSDQMTFQVNSATAMTINSAGNVGIGSAPTNKLDVFGHFTATTKSFLIDHPTKENKKLQYASLEGPEHAVYVRGTHNGSLIELPEYWSELVHADSLTVVLTPLGKHQNLYVKSKDTNHISVGGVKGSYDYVVYGERKDTDKLEVEPLKV